MFGGSRIQNVAFRIEQNRARASCSGVYSKKLYRHCYGSLKSDSLRRDGNEFLGTLADGAMPIPSYFGKISVPVIVR